MRTRHYLIAFGILISSSFSSSLFAQSMQQQASNLPSDSLYIGVVSTEKCLKESKLAKQEQVNFEKMKDQMASVLSEKEKSLESVDKKLNDDAWLDSVSEEEIAKARKKRKAIREEGMELQNQYMQTLQQVNAKSVKKLTDAIAQASEQVAKEGVNGKFYQIILTDEGCTYFDKKSDVSDAVIEKMNTLFDAQSKDSHS